ncbi:hypothetical protein [Anaeromyxobacter oryzae]|uniref:Uncharacterized protein n=1 Tax=Anaeromyxobacter oryzae TaxID=2918170 RepID=A0ABM7WZB5_9BACT|nr:hypothetical protein [Anaeromyxobacter oryzae]BDG04877.1 hypothetical protein AMOR_38730 [Anaeromyxobacter oryzae]
MTVFPNVTRNVSMHAAARRDRWRVLRDLLGGLLIVAVWLFLWGWVAVGVVAPLGRTSGRPAAAERVGT